MADIALFESHSCALVCPQDRFQPLAIYQPGVKSSAQSSQGALRFVQLTVERPDVSGRAMSALAMQAPGPGGPKPKSRRKRPGAQGIESSAARSDLESQTRAGDSCP